MEKRGVCTSTVSDGSRVVLSQHLLSFLFLVRAERETNKQIGSQTPLITIPMHTSADAGVGKYKVYMIVISRAG